MAPDARVAALATRQHGAVSLTQLKAAGLTADAVGRRVRAGRLHRVHRATYAVGHAGLSNEGRWMAAVLACGRGAALSHRSAAELWGFLTARPGPVDVTVRGHGGRKRRDGLHVHRSSSLRGSDTTTRRNIPVTTAARTIVDLRSAVTDNEVRRAIREAGMRGLDVGDNAAKDQTRSELERRFLRLCAHFHLPRPAVNVAIGRYTADFLWQDRQLIVETDGWQAHRGRLAFEEDHARDLDLKLRGYEVVRFTYRQVADDPSAVAGALRVLLS